MSFLAAPALSTSFKFLLDKIASQDMIKIVREYKVLSEIKKWERTLIALQAVLKDAEDKQLTSRAVKIWMEDLQDLAYDVEDVLDKFSTESLRRKVENRNRASIRTVQKLLLRTCTGLSPKTLMFNYGMMSKLNGITTRLKDISDRKLSLDLRENDGGGTSTSTKVWRPPPSGSLLDEPVVYGRDEDKRRIIELLFRNEPGDVKIAVIPIVGMGGLGKTTLARLVYNDEAVKSYFHLTAWVHVSIDYDILRITKGILEAVTSKPCDLKDLNLIQVELNEALREKRFLIVLDDIWNKKYGDWNELRKPLLNGAPGSKIIVTTRLAEVAGMMGTVECLTLEHLSNDDCWSLFARHAFENRSLAANPKLESVGRKIVKKCAGLPLAARTLGGVLRSKEREQDWEAVMTSKIWSLDHEEGDILPVLWLSYYDLPSHLKRCFAYCAIFPEAYEFEEEELVLLWMAEGLIPGENIGEENSQMEGLGRDYFHYLLSRSMFLPSSRGQSRFVMHDLVHKLAQEVAGKTCYRLGDYTAVTERTRHSSFIRGHLDGIKKFEPYQKMKFLRTLLPLSFHLESKGNSMSNNVPHILLSKLRCLRVLSFSGYQIFELPESIGNLKSLRYLDLSYTNIRRLPKSTTTLYNLQTLLLKECRSLKKLPSEIENPINLCHLDISGVDLEEGLPLSIKELRSLQRLSDFVISKDNGSNVTALRNLNFMQGTLNISRLENLTSVSDARFAGLIDKKDLKALSLHWSPQPRDVLVETDVLNELQPHENIEELSIFNYRGNSFPSWMGDISLPNLVVLRLTNCNKCTSLPRLGPLPSLKDLSINGKFAIKTIGHELYVEGCLNPFANLEALSLVDLQEWEDWTTCEVELPCLRELCIENCPRLSATLPKHLPSLKKLVIVDCPFLAVLIPKLPALSELEISNCKEADCMHEVDFDSIDILRLSKIPKVTSAFKEKVVQGIRLAKELVLIEGAVRKRHMSLHFPRWQLDLLPQITSLVVDEEEEQTQQGFAHSNVEALQLKEFERLEKLPEWIYNVKSLINLAIKDCPKLTSFPKAPPTLKRLEVVNCLALQSLLENGTTSTIEYLRIEGCPSLTTLSVRGDLPSTLKHLIIFNCSELASISSRGKLPVGLEELYIFYCPKLESAAENFLDGLHNLASLQSLRLAYWPGIISFLGEGFPANLTRLWISDLNIITPALEWGLHRLAHLHYLTIIRCLGAVSFPSEDIGMRLPGSLIRLTLIDFPDLKNLSTSGFQDLGSLQYLSVEKCPKLASFPKDGLPPSILELRIRRCPLLGQSCHKGNKQQWSHISHIPRVEIGGKSVFDPEYRPWPWSQFGRPWMIFYHSLVDLLRKWQCITLIIVFIVFILVTLFYGLFVQHR